MRIPRASLRSLIGTSGRWLAIILIPLAVNVIIWRALVVPQQANLQAWRNTRALTELQPTLAALLAQTHHTLAEWQRTSFASDDPSAVMQTLRQLAGRHHVDVRQLNVSAVTAETADPKTPLAEASPAGGSVPADVQATGRFNQLARWMSDVETQSGLQVESWQLVPGKAPEQSCQLTVKMTAFLQGTSR